MTHPAPNPQMKWVRLIAAVPISLLALYVALVSPAIAAMAWTGRMPFVDPIEPDPLAAILWLVAAPIVAAASVASITWGLTGRPPSWRRLLIGSGTIIAIPIGLGVAVALANLLAS